MNREEDRRLRLQWAIYEHLTSAGLGHTRAVEVEVRIMQLLDKFAAAPDDLAESVWAKGEAEILEMVK